MDSTPATSSLAQNLPAECYLVKDTAVTFSIHVVGSLLANEKINIVSEINRRITEIACREGELVKKGDLLFKLDESETSAEFRKILAQLDLARSTEERNKELLASGGISRQVYDESLSQLKALEADADYIKVQLDKTQICAPFSGRIGLRNASIGALLSPGYILTTLEDISRLKLDFSLPERYAAAVSRGSVLDFRVEGILETFHAVVEAVESSVEESTRNIRVRAFCENPDNRLTPGRSVNVSMEMKNPLASRYVPSQSLIPTPNGYKIFVLNKGKTELRKVTTGMRSESMVEVREGLEKRDTVVLTNLLRMKSNVAITVQKLW